MGERTASLPCGAGVEKLGGVTPVPADGLCLSYCAVAARNVHEWMIGRDGNGWCSNAKQEHADRAEAQSISFDVLVHMEQEGLILAAARLRLAGAAGYPGMDELGHFANVLGGRLEMVDLENADMPVVTYGSDGPLLYRVGHQIKIGEDGVGADHWVLVRSYMRQQPLYKADASLQLPASPPREGDAIMVLKKQWLDMIVDRGKVLELRGQRKAPGKYYLGCGGQIYGVVTTLTPQRIGTVAELKALLPLHQYVGDELPYKTTWALPLTNVRKVTTPILYVHPRGAIGWVRYKDPSTLPGAMRVGIGRAWKEVVHDDVKSQAAFGTCGGKACLCCCSHLRWRRRCRRFVCPRLC